MSQEEGTNLPQGNKGSLPPSAMSSGTGGSGSSSNSAKLTTKNITLGSKPVTLAINLPQDVEGWHDEPNSPIKTMPTAAWCTGMVGSNSRSINLAGDNNTSGPNPTIPIVVHAAGYSNRVVGSNSKSIKSSSDVGIQVIVKDTDKPTYGGGTKGKGVVKEVMHIWTERERRKKMKNMYNTLHSLLPRFPNKADMTTIVGEAMDYIKTLECTIQRLEKQKMERMCAQNLGASSIISTMPPMHHGAPTSSPREESTLADMIHNLNTNQAMARSFTQLPLGRAQTWCAGNIVLSTIGNDGIISVCMPRQHGVLTKALQVLEKFRIDVVTMNISSNLNRTMFNIHARINAASPDFLRNMAAEDKYRLAVSVMLQRFRN